MRISTGRKTLTLLDRRQGNLVTRFILKLQISLDALQTGGKIAPYFNRDD
jgi:hypothetical protein